MSHATAASERLDERPEYPVSSLDYERERIHRQMLSSVSHDLKTPLASIIGSLEVFVQMKDRLPPQKQIALIDVALQEAHRLNAFITNILDMAKLENGLVTPRPETIEIVTVLRNCLGQIGRQVQGSVINMHAASGVVKADTDAVLLARAIGLVLDNAIKYGGAQLMIHIEFGKGDNRTGYVSVRDNGGGIPADRLETIFEKYTRFAKEDQQNAGTGLGLAIARKILHLLNGHITAANHAEGGALFRLMFPLEWPS